MGHFLRVTRMKRKTKILLTILIVVIATITIIGLNPEYERVLEHNGHRITYRQYLRGKDFLYTGHYVTNDRLVDQAYMKLANRLLDDYIRDNDSQLADEVVKIANEHNLRYTTVNVNIDSLTRNREILLDTTIWIR
jgi:hypothetical protein